MDVSMTVMAQNVVVTIAALVALASIAYRVVGLGRRTGSQPGCASCPSQAAHARAATGRVRSR